MQCRYQLPSLDSMQGITSRDKSYSRVPPEPTASSSGWSKPVTLLLLFGLLCITLSPAQADLVTRRHMLVDISLWEEKEDLRKPCKLEPHERVWGCAWQPKPGRVVIHAVQPKSWCDWVALKTIGHEVMHGLDYFHSAKYAFSGTNKGALDWFGRDCRMAREELGWAVPQAKPKGRE